MTCIVGIKDGKTGEIYLGGDSAAVYGDYIRTRSDPKVFRIGEYLLGFTSSFRMGQILRHWTKIPTFKKGSDPDAHIIQIIDEVFMGVMQKHKFAEEDKKALKGGTFLIGWKYHLYLIESDFQYGRTHDDYMVCGSGTYTASGSLHATGLSRMAPRKRVRRALEAASHHDWAIRAPFTILSTEGGDASRER